MFHIAPDIRNAETLPATFYRDPEAFQRQIDRVFVRSWHLAPASATLQEPGHVAPWNLLEGVLDEPLLLTCDRDGKVHCLSNVCPHRGARVVDQAGPAHTLRCRYHGRRFGLDGRMLAAPGFEDALEFPRPQDSLARVALEDWRGLHFASIDPIMPFGELIAPIGERLGWLPVEAFRFDPASSRDYLVKAHWALYCDNYLEGFHIPFVHHGLAGTLEVGAYTTELYPWASLQVGIAKAGEPAFELPVGHPDEGRRVAAYYLWLFPATMLNFYPWGLSINVVEPTSIASSRVRFLSYVWRPELRGEGAGAGLDAVELEDEQVVESVQIGVRSRLYRRGRYAPRHEAGVHHFHRLLMGVMG